MMPGNHYSMLKEPAVLALADTVKSLPQRHSEVRSRRFDLKPQKSTKGT
jgi:hypothetical protein